MKEQKPVAYEVTLRYYSSRPVGGGPAMWDWDTLLDIRPDSERIEVLAERQLTDAEIVEMRLAR